MGKKVDLEIAKNTSEFANKMRLPELQEALAETLKTVEWLQGMINEIQSYNPKQSSKEIGDGNG